MKLYEITIRPTAGLGTTLKGDTVFGHFCWQVAHDPSLLEGGMERLIASYRQRPFVVFSSAFPKLSDGVSDLYVFKRPDLPLSFLFPSHEGQDRIQRIAERRENKSKRWILVKKDLVFDLSQMEYLSDEDLLKTATGQASSETRRRIRQVGRSKILLTFSQPHNTINRLTQRTGPGQFAPYSQETFHYYPEMQLAIFVLIDEEATGIERVCTALERVGQWGYGKDASIGLGRFNLVGHEELVPPGYRDANACYTLSPSVPVEGSFSEAFFVPFVRFGKHGDILARSANPFKSPVIMADEGAVFVPQNPGTFEKGYLGKAITGLSKALPETIMQGYSIYFPTKLENLA